METKTITTNEAIVREAYRTAEVKDLKGFISLFTDDGYFWDVSAGVKYYGNDVAIPVDIYAKAFPDMHRELLKFFIKDDENVVIVELTLNGTHTGPLAVAGGGFVPPTNNKINAPCCDVWYLENGKIKKFHCYTAGTIMMSQLGILTNLSAAIKK